MRHISVASDFLNLVRLLRVHPPSPFSDQPQILDYLKLKSEVGEVSKQVRRTKGAAKAQHIVWKAVSRTGWVKASHEPIGAEVPGASAVPPTSLQIGLDVYAGGGLDMEQEKLQHFVVVSAPVTDQGLPGGLVAMVGVCVALECPVFRQMEGVRVHQTVLSDPTDKLQQCAPAAVP